MDKAKNYAQNRCKKDNFYIFAPSLKKRRRRIDPWCNWQHNWFWFSRVQVRALAGQRKQTVSFGKLKFVKLYRIVLWCNWQHVWFWIRRVQVRNLTGQLMINHLRIFRRWFFIPCQRDCQLWWILYHFGERMVGFNTDLNCL